MKVEKLAAILATEKIKIGDTQTAIVMLQLTTRALGQIHNSFSNMMSYWEEQVIKCNELVSIAENFSSINGKSDNVKKIRLKRDIGKSGCRWLYTFAISSKSLSWITPTYQTAQRVMANIGGVATNAELEAEIHEKLEQILHRQNALTETKQITEN